jgi:ankyrin repeat protein
LAPGTDGGSALHAACWIGSVNLVSRLLDSGRVPVDLRDPTHGSTPLGWTAFGSVHRGSAAGDYPAVIDRLVAAGADVRAPGNRPGHSLLQMASGNGAVEAALRRHGAA